MKGNVLIIEDNEQNLYLLTFILEKSGYSVESARDGVSGISIARTTKPSFILLDIQLPVMDGYEVARNLRKYKETNDIPIIAVTSYAMPGDRESIIDAGCNGYMEKPVNPETFISEIEEILKGIKNHV